MSIFREEIYQLTKKNILDLEDKSKLKVLSRFSLEHFYHYRFNRYKKFDEMNYKEKFPEFIVLLHECYKPI